MEPKKSDNKKSEAKASDNYSYTTPTGGSYTEHARAAVSQYVNDKKLELTPAQALAAESNLKVVAWLATTRRWAASNYS